MEQPILVSSQATQAPRRGAGFGLRAGAQVIDIIIQTILAVVLGLVIGIFIGIYTFATGTPTSVLTDKLQASTLITTILSLTSYAIYHAICEGMHGATLGKLIFKIHVLNENGNPASFGSALIRSLALFVDGLFFGIVAVVSMRSSELQQRLGDKWAKTVVVERSTINQDQLPSGWKFVMVFLLAIAADSIIYAFQLVLKLL